MQKYDHVYWPSHSPYTLPIEFFTLVLPIFYFFETFLVPSRNVSFLQLLDYHRLTSLVRAHRGPTRKGPRCARARSPYSPLRGEDHFFAAPSISSVRQGCYPLPFGTFDLTFTDVGRSRERCQVQDRAFPIIFYSSIRISPSILPLCAVAGPPPSHCY